MGIRGYQAPTMTLMEARDYLAFHGWLYFWREVQGGDPAYSFYRWVGDPGGLTIVCFLWDLQESSRGYTWTWSLEIQGLLGDTPYGKVLLAGYPGDFIRIGAHAKRLIGVWKCMAGTNI